jgi:flagellin-like hook-associated protein FlgL
LPINTSQNNWATSPDIQGAADNLKVALVTLQSQAQSLSSSLSAVQIRQDFTKAMINALQTGAENLTPIDNREEGANLLALQARQQSSTIALSLAAQAEQNVLRLLW